MEQLEFGTYCRIVLVTQTEVKTNCTLIRQIQLSN